MPPSLTMYSGPMAPAGCVKELNYAVEGDYLLPVVSESGFKISMMTICSSRVKHLPVGLCGEFRIGTFVLDERAYFNLRGQISN